MTEPAVGASVWASGSHVWNGNIGTLIANADEEGEEEPDLERRAGIRPRRAVSSR